jgi:hypothetical protein
MHLFISKGDKALFHCFACGAGGDAADFLQRTMGVNYSAAIHYVRSIEGNGASSSRLPGPGLKTQVVLKGKPSYKSLQAEIELLKSENKLLWEDYGTVYEENCELRKRLGMPEFMPGEPKICS